MSKPSRTEFVRETVQSTLNRYLTIYCMPTHTVEQAHKRCLDDAERLADKVFGVTDAVSFTVVDVTSGRNRAQTVTTRQIEPSGSGLVKREIVTRSTHSQKPVFNSYHDPHPSITRRIRKK